MNITATTGDHAVNLAEWVVFSVTGEHKGEKP